MDAEGRSEACDLGGRVYPERDGAANVEVVISVALDEFHVRPPLTYRLARGHGLVDEGHRRGNSPFRAPVVDLDGARPDHDTPRHADSTGDADTRSRLYQATLLFGPTVLEVERRSHRASSNGYRANLSSTPGSPTRSGFTLLSFPRRPVIAPAPGPTTPGPGASDPVYQAGIHRLNDPGLLESSERYTHPGQRDDRGTHDWQQARHPRLESEPLEQLSGVDHKQSDPGQNYRQPRTEREDEHHPERQPVERDRTEKQNERRRTRHEPTADAERHHPGVCAPRAYARLSCRGTFCPDGGKGGRARSGR